MKKMIHDASNPLASVPEELYNLTQLADVTLAAGKLSTTNIQTIKDYIKSDESTSPELVTDSNQPLNIMELSGNNMKRCNSSSGTSESSITMNSPHKLFSDCGYISDMDCTDKKTFLYALHSRQSQSMDSELSAEDSGIKSIKSFSEQRQSSFSSSEDDSTYNYSHKIFDKRKSRKLHNQSNNVENIHNTGHPNPVAIETEDSMLSISETESTECYVNQKTIKNKLDSTKLNDYDSKSSIDASDLINGMSAGDDIHTCPECGKKYSTSSNLARHRQTHRSLLDKKARRCPHCDKVYVSMPAYSMHVRTHNQGCECPHCGKRFSRPWLLQGHIRTHTGEKPFACQQCGKKFADKSNLRAHIQTHSNTKPHTCGRCGKAFALKSYLYKHEESSCMRNYAKSDKEKHKKEKNDTMRLKTPKKLSTYNSPAMLKKTKESKSIDDVKMNCVNTSNSSIPKQSIFLDVGSKKSYIDLTDSKIEPYSRISVIRTVGSQPKPTIDHPTDELDKPVDFSSNHRIKNHFNESSNNLTDNSHQYATMVV